MLLSDFINRHAGETAWLFGKGPSLSTFDFSTSGHIRAAINDAIIHVPDCLYGFANDGVRHFCDVFQRHQVLFQPNRCLGEFDSTARDAVACQVVTFPDYHTDLALFESRETLANGLAIRRGTLGSALQILHIMGISTVHLIGIDGGTQRADLPWRGEQRQDIGREYDAIRNEAIDAAQMMGLTLKFHNHDHTMETDGKVFVRVLSNIFAESIPYCNGQIVSFVPRVAADLVREGAAEYFTPPEKAKQAETAEAPIEARESAVIKTSKGKR